MAANSIHTAILMINRIKFLYKLNVMMNRTGGFILIMFLFFISACNKDNSSSSNGPFASVSVYALSPDAPGFNLFINGANYATNIPFGSYTLYNPVAPGNAAVRMQTIAGNIAVDTTITTSEGNNYSLFLVDSLSSIKSSFLQDNLTAPATDTSVGLRFFTFSPDAPAVDVHVLLADSSQQVWWQNRKFTDDAASDSINKFVSKPAGIYSFYILKSNSNKDTLATFTRRSFTTSANYTLLLEGMFTNADKSDTTLQLGIRKH